MYIPAVRSIPLLEKKGEFQAEAGVSTNSVYANTSYAITDNIAISLNGNLSYRNFTNYYDIFTHKDDCGGGSLGSFLTVPDPHGTFAHRYGEISVGKIDMLSASRAITRGQKLEIFGGAGIGRATEPGFDYPQCNYYSLFGQGNFGKKRQNFETGVSMRLAYSLFDYIGERSIGNGEYSLWQTYLNVIHVEPMFVLRLGRGNLKAVLRGGINLAFTLNPNEEHAGRYGFNYYKGEVDWTIFHFSVGASYRLGGKQTKNKYFKP